MADPPNETPASLRRRRAAAAASATCVVLCAALLWGRMGLESSLWCDETYSLVLSAHPWRRIVDLTAIDAHPPGYYLLLKAWNRLTDAAGLPPGIRTARALNLLPWLAAAAVVWVLGRGLWGGAPGALPAWALLVGAMGHDLARDLRSYAVAAPALAIAWSILWRLDAGRCLPRRLEPVPAALLWAGCAGCMAAALWVHLLCAPAVALLAMAWALRAARGPGRRGWLLGGAAAFGAAAVAFVPWGLFLGSNVRYWQEAEPDFLTPPTLANLGRVFALWYPLGQLVGGATTLERPDRLLPLGAAACVATLGALGWATARARREEASAEPLASRELHRLNLAWTAASFAVAALYVAGLWGLDRWGGFAVFHGPRYTTPVWGLWAIGVGGAAALAARSSPRPRLVGWALVAPWALCGAVAYGLDLRLERQVGLGAAMAQPGAPMPPPGTPIYVVPSELIPYYRKTLAAYPMHPIEALFELPENREEAVILNVSPYFTTIRQERDIAAMAAVVEGALSAHVDVRRFPTGYRTATYYLVLTLTGMRREGLADWRTRGWRTLDVPVPPGALGALHPREFLFRDGWNSLESDARGRPGRWTKTDPAAIRWPTPLGPGRYRLRIEGIRHSLPPQPVALRVRVEGERGEAVAWPPIGTFQIDLPLTIEHRHRRPVLWLHYPVRPPTDPASRAPGEPPDRRRIGLLVHRIWIEPEGAQQP